MDIDLYKNKFEQVLQNISKEEFESTGLKLSVDEVLESVTLKIYKPEWSNDFQFPLRSKSRIFFSVWVNDKTIKEGKIYYNLHALKLRELKDYKISSRDFAGKFRTEFIKYEKNWENVSTNFGPLTLMEGWIHLSLDTIHTDLSELAQKFLKISFLIDEALDGFKS